MYVSKGVIFSVFMKLCRENPSGTAEDAVLKYPRIIQETVVLETLNGENNPLASQSEGAGMT